MFTFGMAIFEFKTRRSGSQFWENTFGKDFGKRIGVKRKWCFFLLLATFPEKQVFEIVNSYFFSFFEIWAF